MFSKLLSACWLGLSIASTAAQTQALPPNLVADGIPPIPSQLAERAARYLDFRTAEFQSWHPKSGEMLITTRFADTPQLHSVSAPGGARRQITFRGEPIGGGSFQPLTGRYIVFSQDQGGGEFFQLYRLDPADGTITLLTDGKSRNTGARWSTRGDRLAYTSTRRNGRDTDVWLMNPEDPKTDRMLLSLEGGGWRIADWSENDALLLLVEYVSINESYLWIFDVVGGTKKRAAASFAHSGRDANKPLTPRGGEKIAYNGGIFSKDGSSIITASDQGSEFLQLGRLDLASGQFKVLIPGKWDVTSYDLSRDGHHLAYIKNEDGSSVLRIADARTGRTLWQPDLPKGIIGGLEWSEDGARLGFSFSSARSSGDAYSAELKSRKIVRWTHSEIGGLNSEDFAEPDLVKMKSFDGLEIAAFVYRPDPRKFPGKRPVVVQIHGGPESLSRPGFLARGNYLISEMGIALVVPNVRGSAGYGKTFLTLDNGFKREDSVKDIGTVLDWIAQQPAFDPDRIAVTGGSYGGYMALASMIHFADKLRAGVDIVGISNFLTFLANTQDYRRDLRRVEYGDERDPAMRDFLQKISPSVRAREIVDPLFIIQGKNDPRVPLSESEQMLAAVRQNNRHVWYLMATDEGHGFRKKSNQDIQFLSTLLFFETYLLK